MRRVLQTKQASAKNRRRRLRQNIGWVATATLAASCFYPRLDIDAGGAAGGSAGDGSLATTAGTSAGRSTHPDGGSGGASNVTLEAGAAGETPIGGTRPSGGMTSTGGVTSGGTSSGGNGGTNATGGTDGGGLAGEAGAGGSSVGGSPAAECVGHRAGDNVCSSDGTTVLECGADSSTTTVVQRCPAAKPVCWAGTCGVPNSCAGLTSTCGGSDSCCSSLLVPGGTFYRTSSDTNHNDNRYPATVSAFRLDKYEITVGRFKKFVAAYKQSLVSGLAGKGANPNNKSGDDKGWETTWNSSLPADSSALTTDLECDAAYQTLDAGVDQLPINCLNWFTAEAFCIWDGGRLPTSTEWSYAATGGDQQRLPYPWGTEVPGANASLAIHGCFFPAGANGTCTGFTNIAPVGTASGDGRWGHADLAGNLWEWVQDRWTSGTPTMPCNDCANLAGTESHRFRWGGSFKNSATYLGFRGNDRSLEGRTNENGARCARAP